jgi:hypothetical protein
MKAFALARIDGVDLAKVDLAKLQENLKKCGLHVMQSTGGARIKPSTYAWAIAASVKEGGSCTGH